MDNILIVIPAYHPGEELVTYVNDLIHSGFSSILVIDDGSGEKYKHLFNIISGNKEVTLLQHAINLGKGRALKNSINYFLNNYKENGWEGMITVDSDGQHLVDDVIEVSECLVKNTDSLILGTRNFDTDNVPFKSKFGNKLTKQVFKILYGKGINDTQTGLRGIPKNILPYFIDLAGERFSYETDVLIRTVSEKIEIIEVPIQTVYIDGNSETHFRPIKDSLEIYGLLFKNFFKFFSASILSFIIDISFFHLFVNMFVFLTSGTRILTSTILARIISSGFNYTVNRQYVFNSKKDTKTSFVKYYTLVLLQLLVSALLVYIIYNITGIHETVIKFIVDSLLFFLSYRIQKEMIF
jgi:dolichol-phosphate mannosyltransferase